jgi:hypothetical protein
MNRPLGVTASAIVAILGSAACTLFSGLLVAASLLGEYLTLTQRSFLLLRCR